MDELQMEADELWSIMETFKLTPEDIKKMASIIDIDNLNMNLDDGNKSGGNDGNDAMVIVDIDRDGDVVGNDDNGANDGINGDNNRMNDGVNDGDGDKSGGNSGNDAMVIVDIDRDGDVVGNDDNNGANDGNGNNNRVNDGVNDKSGGNSGNDDKGVNDGNGDSNRMNDGNGDGNGNGNGGGNGNGDGDGNNGDGNNDADARARMQQERHIAMAVHLVNTLEMALLRDIARALLSEDKIEPIFECKCEKCSNVKRE